MRTVKAAVTLPVAVKLSPFFTSLPHFAKALEGAGANGLVLFNRFYQPDLDIEALEVEPSLNLSTRPPCACACAGWASCTARPPCPWP